MTANGSSLSERLLMPPSLLLRSLIVPHNYYIGVTTHLLLARCKCPMSWR
jgi:hypothetical protein